MRAQDQMTTPVVTAKPHDSVGHARELMAKQRINQLPVVLNGRVVGIVSDRDLRDAFPSVFEDAHGGHRRRKRASSDPKEVTVEDIMTSKVLTLPPSATVAEAAGLMRRERIGAVPIVEHDRLVGILSRSDVLQAYIALAKE